MVEQLFLLLPVIQHLLITYVLVSPIEAFFVTIVPQIIFFVKLVKTERRALPGNRMPMSSFKVM